jgi:hypothetical protein
LPKLPKLPKLPRLPKLANLQPARLVRIEYAFGVRLGPAV